jgi:hypothetical protein
MGVRPITASAGRYLGMTEATLRSTDGLLASVEAFVTRYVVLTANQATAVALWVLHTHTIDAAGITPYLSITSAEKASGKTTLLETLEAVVARP